MHSETQIHSTLQGFICSYGPPCGLFSDGSKAAFSSKSKISFVSSPWAIIAQSLCNRTKLYPIFKTLRNKPTSWLDHTGAPATMCLLCMLYAIDLHNHLSSTNLPLNITPIQWAFRFVSDISKFLLFHWWQPVLYKSDNKEFPIIYL